MGQGGSSVSRFLKTVIGVLAISIVISGITLYFTRKREAIVYNFDPENAYVYTFNRENFRLSYENDPKKSVTLFSDGFNPLCILGCKKSIEGDELPSSLVQGSPGGTKADDRSDPRFVYLSPGESLNLEMDLGKGNSVRSRYPYSNRLILELEDESDLDDLSLKVYGYPFEDEGIEPEEADLTEVDFSYSGDFGKSSVFVLPSPHFVSRVQFGAGQGSEDEIGLREASLYLERNEFISIVSKLKNNLSIKNEERAQELEAKLEEARGLDPYSPTTDYLLAEVYSSTEDHESAMDSIDRALKKMETYGDFLVPRVDFNDLSRRKARIAGDLGEWDKAIRYMERATPEVDHDFLSEVYLSRYEDSENPGDLDSSFFNAVLAYQDRPRLVLGVLRKYSKQESWLEYGLNYFSERVKESDGVSYRLENERKVSSYLINLSVALLEFWRGGEGSFERAKDQLTAAEESTDNTEKLALIDSIKGRFYQLEGDEGRAKQYEERAMEYFSDYSSLYDEWIGFLETGIQ